MNLAIADILVLAFCSPLSILQVQLIENNFFFTNIRFALIDSISIIYVFFKRMWPILGFSEQQFVELWYSSRWGELGCCLLEKKPQIFSFSTLIKSKLKKEGYVLMEIRILIVRGHRTFFLKKMRQTRPYNRRQPGIIQHTKHSTSISIRFKSVLSYYVLPWLDKFLKKQSLCSLLNVKS